MAKVFQSRVASDAARTHMVSPADITIVIPTYGREGVLLDTLLSLRTQIPQPGGIIVIDQTPIHLAQTEQALRHWEASGYIRRILFTPPSIPRAMNLGLLASDTEFVLFLDDDIIPKADLVASLLVALDRLGPATLCIAGQVLQPGESVISFASWAKTWFPFNSDVPQFIDDVMAGNLCVRRKKAMAIGGFDENFKGAAMYFESEFARRVRASGGAIAFEPDVSIRHLRSASGGTRIKGTQFTTWRPHHSVGKYYIAFLKGPAGALRALLIEPVRAIRTRHHLAAPWWIPATLCAEVLGILWASMLMIQGRRLIDTTDASPLSWREYTDA